MYTVLHSITMSPSMMIPRQIQYTYHLHVPFHWFCPDCYIPEIPHHDILFWRMSYGVVSV